MVGFTLFANKSVTHVLVVFLDAFRDLGQTGSYEWRVATMVHIWGPSIVIHRPERVVGQFGYVQTIPPHPVAPSLSTEDDIDDKWIQFSEYLAPVGQTCVAPR
ncbi:hypothetical protein GmHk_10G028474 [Glycine max]|nr:hypothetical protein GmHk_10G028474 [Glycine max]